MNPTTDENLVTVEFFGITRLKANRAELTVPATTVGEALIAVEEDCPELKTLRVAGHISPHYLVSINGKHFVKSLDEQLTPGDRLLLLSADAGG
jgi:molybdopterin converting factor small subunit